MKTFLQYLKIFRKPIIVPVMTFLSFFLTMLMLLFVLNQTIINSLEKRMTLFENQSILLTINNLHETDYRHLEQIIPNVEIRATYSHTENDGILTIQTNSSKSYTRSNWLLASVDNGILVQDGYAEHYMKYHGEFPQFIKVLGEDFKIVGTFIAPPYDEHNTFYRVSYRNFFKLLAGKQISLNLSVPNDPTRNEMQSMVEQIKSKGVDISNVVIKDWESTALPSAKSDFYYSFLFVVLFLILNLLFVFNYILRTRNKKIQLLRLLGISRRRARFFIFLEIQLTIIGAYLIACLVSFYLFPMMREAITFLDYIIIPLYISLIAGISIWLSTRKIIDKNLTLSIKENFYVE